MSTIAPPPLPPNPALANSEGYIDEQIRRTRRSLKLLDLGAGLLTLTIGLLAFVLVGALLDHWIIPGGLNVAGRATLFALMLAGLAWYGWRQFIPLLKPINPVYAAQTIEQNAPSLKNSLLNLLLFRSHRNYLSARVYHALEQQTAAKLSKASLEASIDRSALLRLGYALLAIITVCALYALLSPKSLGLSTVRVLAPWSDVTPPSRVQILDVKPGSTSVARGERVEISAQINGLSGNEPVRLRYSTADEQTVDESIRMERPSPEARRFEGFLPRGTDSGVMQDLTYWIEAGDARTEKFKLSVFERPTIVVQKIHYDYPRYTGLPAKDSVQNGDVKGLDGTEVTISALASQPIKTASLDFDADGSNDKTMTVEGDRATVRFKLGFRDGSSTPLHPKYALRFTTADGRANTDPTVHSIEVTRDLPPEVSITDPEEKEQVARVSDLLTVGVEARDPDYGLKRVAIIGKVNDKPEQPLFEMLEKVHTGRFGAIKTYTPGELGLKPGDLLEYWAVAEDSRPEANTAFTDHYRLKIIGPDKPQAGQQPPKNGGQQQPDKQQGGENGEQGGQGGGGGEGEAQSGEGGSSGGQGESGESQGKQQEGEGSAGGGSGKNESGESEESSDKAGENGGGGSGGEGEESSENQSSRGNSQGSNSGQSGGQEQQSSSGESKPGEAGQQGDSADQQSGGEQSKVASGGEDDGTAFQRMAEHMGEQEGAGEGKPNPAQQGQGKQAEQAQPGESAGDQGEQNNTPQQGAESAQQTNGQGGQQKPQAGASGKQQEGAAADEAQDAANQTNQDEQNGESPEQSSTGAAQGSQKGSNQKPQADGAQPQGPNQKATGTEQKTDAAGDNPSKREGANIPEEAKPGDGNPEDQQAGQEPGSDSEMNRNNGNSGSGHSAGEKEGAPGNDQSMREGRDKQDEDNRPGQDDQEPPSGSGDKKESNSKGGQSGEQSGGGKQGAGQKADAAGKGGSGQHEAADQGAGKAEEQGEGETGTNAGNQQQADGKTGQSSGDQPGNGSKQGETGENQPSEGEQQPGEQGGQSPSAGGQQGQGANRGAQQPQPNEQPGGEQPEGGQQPGGQSGGEQSANQSKSEGEQSGDPSDQQPPNGANSSGAAKPMGGGTGSNAMSSPSTESGQLGADDPNLDYAKKQTDLVLERLDEQLAKKQVDQTLLKKLGWTEDELQRFVDRWKNLKASAAGEGEAANEAKQELDDTLRNLLPRSNGPLKFRGHAKADDLRANDALRVKPPSEYADRVREYTKGISSQRKD